MDEITKFCEELLSVRKNEKLFDFIIDKIMVFINCNQASIMLFDLQGMKLRCMRVRGFKTTCYKTPQIRLTGDVAKSIFEGGEVLAPFKQDKHKFIIIFDEDERKYFDCELRIPFFILENSIGVLNLGKKSTGTEYSLQDIHLLQVLINISTIAIENLILSTNTAYRKSIAEETGDVEDQPVHNIQIKRSTEIEEMIGKSNTIKKIKSIIRKVAPKDVTVCITGESGTGKELVANAIHLGSSRRHRPLVTLNCAALPENLVESELFGHEKGAFTGAHKKKKGKFEFANHSTLFLDEIGDMSHSIQAKLLRVLQHKTFQRLGGNENIEVDVRIIVATHKDLTELIKDGCFREDLYYRINVVQVNVPPLRERKEDIPQLVEYFLRRYSEFYGNIPLQLGEDELLKLVLYDFPGNIRELKNIIERAVILAQDGQLSLDFLPHLCHKAEKNVLPTTKPTLENLEKDYIKQVLDQVNYNKTKAARILGIARKTLREKISKYNIKQ